MPASQDFIDIMLECDEIIEAHTPRDGELANLSEAGRQARVRGQAQYIIDILERGMSDSKSDETHFSANDLMANIDNNKIPLERHVNYLLAIEAIRKREAAELKQDEIPPRHLARDATLSLKHLKKNANAKLAKVAAVLEAEKRTVSIRNQQLLAIINEAFDTAIQMFRLPNDLEKESIIAEAKNIVAEMKKNASDQGDIGFDESEALNVAIENLNSAHRAKSIIAAKKLINQAEQLAIQIEQHTTENPDDARFDAKETTRLKGVISALSEVLVREKRGKTLESNNIEADRSAVEVLTKKAEGLTLKITIYGLNTAVKKTVDAVNRALDAIEIFNAAISLNQHDVAKEALIKASAYAALARMQAENVAYLCPSDEELPQDKNDIRALEIIKKLAAIADSAVETALSNNIPKGVANLAIEAMVGVPANTPVVNEGFWSAFKAFLQDIVSALTNFVASIDEVGVSRRQSFEVTGKTRSYAHIKEGRPGSDFNVAKPQGNIPRIIFIYTNKNAHSYSIWPDYSKRDYIELKVVENQGPDGLLHRLSRVAKIKITKQGQGDDGFSLIRIKGRKEDPKNFKKALKFFASYSHSYVPLPNDYIRLEVIDNADLVGLVRQLSVSGIEMTKLKGENGFCFIHIEGRYNLEKALQFFVDHPHYELSPQACKTLDHILNVLSTEKLDDAIEEALYLDSDDEPLSDSSVLEVKQAEPLSTSNNSAQQNQEDSAAMRRAIGSSELTAEIERTKRTIDAYQVRGEVVPSSISRKYDQLLKELELSLESQSTSQTSNAAAVAVAESKSEGELDVNSQLQQAAPVAPAQLKETKSEEENPSSTRAATFSELTPQTAPVQEPVEGQLPSNVEKASLEDQASPKEENMASLLDKFSVRREQQGRDRKQSNAENDNGFEGVAFDDLPSSHPERDSEDVLSPNR